MKKPVYTYHAQLPGNMPEEHTKLLLLWKRNWESAGYTPIVLNEYIAGDHPQYQAFSEAIDKLPTVNPPEYERACYLRWMAIAVAGGGLMADSDVFIYNDFRPGPVPDRIVSFQTHVPALVWGSKSAYENMVQAIMAYQVSPKDLEGFPRPHVSDMLMLQRGGIPYTSKNVVKLYNEPGWEQAPLVHYSHSSMGPAKLMPRHKFIEGLRPWK